MLLRGPYDVVNLARLFGLSTSDAKHSLGANCRSVLMHGEMRTTLVKCTLGVQSVPDVPAERMWAVRESDAMDDTDDGEDIEDEA